MKTSGAGRPPAPRPGRRRFPAHHRPRPIAL